MAAANQSVVELTDLLPSSPYLLAYALPLLLLSTLLTLAGAFLTLDRTRSFAPRDDVLRMPASFDLKKKSKSLPHFYLEGGLGGVAVGYSLGLHLSTFLALVIPDNTPAAPLAPKPFLAVWILSALPLAVLAGRFKYVTAAFSGITGGTSLALAVSISIHPSLLTRRIILALLVPTLTILIVLPIPRTHHPSIRLASCATGTFGLILAIALFVRVDAWANAWDRFWIMDGDDWGTGAEHGLTAGYWLILISGCLSDWALKRVCGGNPDEKWDTYLTEYAGALPLASDRAGTFQPLPSGIFARLFPWAHRSKTPADTKPLFDLVEDDKSAPLPHVSFEGVAKQYPVEKEQEQRLFVYEDTPRLLRKASQSPLARIRALGHSEGFGHRKREAVKFGLANGDDVSSDDDDDPLSSPPPRRLNSTRSSGSRTLTNGSATPQLEKEDALEAKRKAIGSYEDGALDYSDYEEDVTADATRKQPRDSADWIPPFLSRHRSQQSASGGTPAGAVRVTPSLIHAIDRLAVAQAEAYGPPQPHVGLPIPSGGPNITAEQRGPETSGKESDQRWDTFWRDVTTKAGEGARR